MNNVIFDSWCEEQSHRAKLSDKITTKKIDPGEISDGYHTFNELYAHRTALLAALVKVISDVEYVTTNPVNKAWKSKLHADGTMYDGMFIVGIEFGGVPITYHCEMEWWPSFHCKEYERAPEWDGHTPADVVERLTLFANGYSISHLDKK